MVTNNDKVAFRIHTRFLIHVSENALVCFKLTHGQNVQKWNLGSKLTVNIIIIVNNNNNKFCVKARMHIYICTETCSCMQVAA